MTSNRASKPLLDPRLFEPFPSFAFRAFGFTLPFPLFLFDQITAFGQKQGSFWVKFFDFVSKVVNSPIISTASKGFGIPVLATQALTFVDGVLDVIAQQNKLVDLWKT